MTRLSDLSIRAKVLCAFGAVLVITIGLGLFSIQRLGAVNSAATDIRDNWLPSTVLVDRMAKLAERYRIYEARYLMAESETERNELLPGMEETLAEIKKARHEYEPLVTPGEERQIIDNTDKAWMAYLDVGKQVRNQVQAGDMAGAHKLFSKAGFETFGLVRKGLNDDVELNVREGKKSADNGAAIYRQALWWIVAVLVAAAVASTLVGIVVVAGIAGPVQKMTVSMRRLADHDLTAEIVGIGRKDEVGAMADAVQVFKTSMIESDRLTAERLAEAEARTLRAEQREQLTNAFENKVERIIATVSSAAEQVRGSSETLAGTATQTSERANATAAASEEASANVQTVASATEELAASTNAISEQVAKAAQTASQACDEAARTDKTVKGLAAAANKIGDVVNLINDIASQTNLLALNATIEAARAGEAGKGFAVVAGEVKSLANQTAKATEEIRREVEEMQTASHEAAKAIEDIVGTISNINEISTAIAAAVEEQGAATQEIARNVQEAALGTQEVSTNIVLVNDAAGETGSAAQQMQIAAESLNQEADALRREVETFLTGVKAI